MTPWFNYPTFHWKTRHAIVIGAGIAGCQMTWHLSKLGWRVTLLEQAPAISQRASGNLTGVISPKMTAQPSSSERFYHQAFDYTLQQLQQLAEGDCILNWFPSGMLQLNHNERELQRWTMLKERDFSSSFLQFVNHDDATKIAGIPCHYSASYFPQAGYINPASFCQALLSDSNHELITSTSVNNILPYNESWQVNTAGGATLAPADIVIFCTGNNLNQLPQSQYLSSTGVLGQTTLAEVTEESNELNCVICHEGYVTPNYDGKHVFGATFERSFKTVALTNEATIKNTQQLKNYLPEWQATLQHIRNGHAAVRTTTPDRFPYTGALPNVDFYQSAYESLKFGRPKEVFPEAKYQKGLFVLGGFGSRGLTTSGYCAQLLSQLINNHHKSDQDALLSTLHPARFLIRQLRKGHLIQT